MLQLNSTQKLQLTTSAAATLDVHVSGVDVPTPFTPTSNSTPYIKNSAISTATDTDIADAPGANVIRNLKCITMRNRDGSLSDDVTLKIIDSAGADPEIFKCTLAIAEELIMAESVIFHFDASGAVIGTAVAASTTQAGAIKIAAQSDMEAGTSLVLAATPGNLGWHPSSCKYWGLLGISGSITASFNLTSIADTGTGVVTVTIATDFSSASYCALGTIELTSTTVAQSCTTDSRAAGSIVYRSVVEAGSSADPVTWAVCGFGDQ